MGISGSLLLIGLCILLFRASETGYQYHSEEFHCSILFYILSRFIFFNPWLKEYLSCYCQVSNSMKNY